MLITDVLDVNWKAVGELFEKSRLLKTSGVENWSFSMLL